MGKDAAESSGEGGEMAMGCSWYGQTRGERAGRVEERGCAIQGMEDVVNSTTLLRSRVNGGSWLLPKRCYVPP